MCAVFTYGSLMFPEVWALFAEKEHESKQARIYGYQRHAVRGADYPILVPRASGDLVDGVVYFNIRNAEQENTLKREQHTSLLQRMLFGL